MDMLDTRRIQDTTTIACRAERDAEARIVPSPITAISYRLIHTTASAFPMYVDAHAPSPHPPALSPLIDGTGSALAAHLADAQ